jgi:hypothetical protein
MAAIGMNVDAPIYFSQPMSAGRGETAQLAEGSSLAGRAAMKPENISRRQKNEENQARIELVRKLLKADEPRVAEAEIHLHQLIHQCACLNRTQKMDVILILYAMSLHTHQKKWEFLSVSMSTTAAPSDQDWSSWRKKFIRKSL